MKIEFDLKKNAYLGQGLVIVDGKFYGLPIEAAKLFEDLLKRSLADHQTCDDLQRP